MGWAATTSIGAAASWSATAPTDASGAPPREHRLVERAQHGQRIIPADASVGDALAVLQLPRVVLAGAELLRAVDQVALDHQPEDATRAVGDLRRDVARHRDLTLVLRARVGVTSVDHQPARQLGRFDLRTSGGDAGRVVIW